MNPKRQLFIEYSDTGIRTALLEDGKLLEIFIDSNEASSWVGKVIVGRIKTILPGLFAFVDIGSNKNAFINLEEGHNLKAGQPILVQVCKDATGSKGAYLQQEISLKSHILVLSESGNKISEIGISRKITDEAENKRLRKLAKKFTPKGFSLIVRTDAKGIEPTTLEQEINTLHATILEIKKKAEYALPPVTLFPIQLTANTITKNLSSIDEVYIESSLEIFSSIKEIKSNESGAFSQFPLFHYTNTPSLFVQFNINKQITNALSKIIYLPSGGFITIEQTEACVVIDVNTGSFIGKKDYRTTILQTNLEAASAIATQLTLRNLSGIIIVDFIDLENQEDKTMLLNTLAQELNKTSSIKTDIVGMTELGLVQLTRKKTRPSLSEVLQKKCPHCGRS